MLRIILEQPAAATFLTTKIYRFFVNDVPNPAHIEPLAVAFRKSGYDIADLLERLFSADWFYEPANVGTHIKSPVELLAGIRRTLSVKVDNDQVLLGYQKALGQTLFQPPNVAGWPGGRNWIDSSSLLLRLQLPAILFRNAEFAVALKQDENDIAPNQTRAERLVRAGAGAHLPLAPLQQLLGATPAAAAAREAQQLPAASHHSARKPAAGAAGRRAKRARRSPARHAGELAELAGVSAGVIRIKLPSFFKEGK